MKTLEQTQLEKISALAKHLKLNDSDISCTDTAGQEYESENYSEEWLVLDDDEADQKAREYILDSLWAFNAEFIASHTREGLDPIAIDALRDMQGKLCESANEIVKALIADIDHFIDDAIKADGRGHFIANYDNEELELEGGFYAYRTN